MHSMDDEQRATKEFAKRGRELYERSVRGEVEPEHDGRFLALDVESGDYEVGDEALPTSARLRDRKPDAALYLMKIGRPAAYRLGGRSPAVRS